jgi:hypothetical protein
MSTVKEKDLLKMDLMSIRSLDPKDIERELSPKEIIHIFVTCNAFWRHPAAGNPKAPHALLTTGKHSDIYVNCPRVLSYSNLCQIMAFQLFSKLSEVYKGPINWVLGSDSSALGLSKDIANLAKAQWHPMQKVKSPGGEERQVWEKAVILPGETVLHVEELMVTSTTFQRVRKGIKEAHPEYPVQFVPYVPVLILRPKDKKPIKIHDQFITALYIETMVVDVDEGEECPLCAQGSEALKPKGENWKKMVDSMI